MGKATLNATVLNDGGLDCEGRFQYGVTPAFGTNTAWQNTLRTGDSFSAIITGLPAGTTIYFRAQVRNALGTTSGATLTFNTLVTALVVSTDPATAIGTTSAVLNGTLVEDLGFGCETRFEYGGTAAYGNVTPWIYNYVEGDSFSNDVDNLSPGRSFHFRAVARNRLGIGYGKDRSFTTRGLREPGTGFQIVFEPILEAM